MWSVNASCCALSTVSQFSRVFKCLWVLIAAMLLTFTGVSHANVKVVGYLPSYQNINKQIDKIDLSKITHLILAFLHPDKQGQFYTQGKLRCMYGQYRKLLSSNDLRNVIEKAQQADVKVLIAIGGSSSPRCAGQWPMLLSEKYRAQTVLNLAEFIERHKFDGLAVDFEAKVLSELVEQGSFYPFIQKAHTILSPQGKTLSAATGSFEGGMLPQRTIEFFDYVSIKSYDAVGPNWGKSGVEHSTFTNAKKDIQLWRTRGLPKEKLILGLPFYGYGFGQYNANYGFTDIVKEFGRKKSGGDLIGQKCPGCSYISFNGYHTIKAKTELALQHGAGVMIWELTKDRPDNNGLLNAIDETIKQWQQVNNVQAINK